MMRQFYFFPAIAIFVSSLANAQGVDHSGGGDAFPFFQSAQVISTVIRDRTVARKMNFEAIESIQVNSTLSEVILTSATCKAEIKLKTVVSSSEAPQLLVDTVNARCEPR